LEPDHPLRTALSAQMLCAYLMRVFAQDLIEQLARHQSSNAVSLAPEIARFLGVGNGSALGLVLFVNNHPRLIDRWLSAHEQALAAAKALPLMPGSPLGPKLLRLIDRAIAYRREDRVSYDHRPSSSAIADDLVIIRAAAARLDLTAPFPLAALCDAVAAKVGPEALETLHSLLIELVPETADALAETLVVDEETITRPEMSAGRLRELLHAGYRWALDMDLSTPESARYVWYKSRNAEEPRRGPWSEVAFAHNLGLDLPRLAQALDKELADGEPKRLTAHLLLQRPDLRAFVARIQSLEGLAYHSPMMNMMGEGFVPIDVVGMMNVAIHGIDKTRDYLNRNLRGVLYHGAPLPDEIAAGASDDWFWPMEAAR
jgi:hypothetical protein